MFSAGSVSATLSGNFNPAGFMAFDASMKKAHASMDAVEAKGGRMNKTLATVGKVGATAAAGGILAVGIALGKSVSIAADFEQQMSRLKATTHASAATMAQFKKDAMAAGAATKFSALDAAKAQTELAKGGIKVQDMAGGLKATLALAAAGELDLSDAAATTVNAMKQFSLGGDSAMHVADALATAANNTTTDVGELGLALRQGGGVAAMAGASFDETVAALSALADASVKGSDAGTSLKSFFLNIATPSKQARESMHGLGMSIFTTSGDLKSMPAIAENLRSAFGHLTKEQFLNKAGVIAGSDAARALFAIYKAGPEGMRDYIQAQKEVGTAAETAAEKQNNFRGKLENLKGSIETLQIAVGTGLLPVLSDAADAATKFVNEIQSGTGGGGQFLRGAKDNLDDFLGMVTFAIDGAKLLMQALSLGDKALGGQGFDKQINALDGFSDKLNHLREGLRKPFGVTAKVDQAIDAINSVDNKKIKPKIAKVIANGDTTVKQKIAALIALGIPTKQARIIAAGIPQTIADIARVNAALGGIHDKTVSITTINRIANLTDTAPKLTQNKPKHARGRGPGGAETALVGEGHGPELVGNASKGFQLISGPTLVGLAPGDSVIPTDPQYGGRALGLMFAALGVPGYAAGRPAWGKTPAKTPAKKLAVPARVQYGAVSEDDLRSARDNARDGYQKRKDRVHDLDVDIRAQQRKVGSAKGKAKRKEQAKLAELQRDRHRYNDGGGGLKSLVEMRKRYTDLNRQVGVLHRYNLDIERLNAVQETDRVKMATASKKGDGKGWQSAKTARDAILKTLQGKYKKALGLAAPGSNFAAELEGKLAGIEGDIADSAAEIFEPELTKAEQDAKDATDRLSDTGMTDEERNQLAALQAGVSLAALTPGTDDDKTAAQGLEGFLTGALQRAQADPSRGGAASVRDIADQLKSARDNVASFSGAGANDNADLQAQLEQARTATSVALRNSEIDSRALSVYQGWSAQQQPAIVQNNYMLHPGSPEVQTAVAEAAVAGMSYQANRQSPRTNSGL